MPRDAARRHDVGPLFTSTNGRIQPADGTATQAVSSCTHCHMSLKCETYSCATIAKCLACQYSGIRSDGRPLVAAIEHEPGESSANSGPRSLVPTPQPDMVNRVHQNRL